MPFSLHHLPVRGDKAQFVGMRAIQDRGFSFRREGFGGGVQG